MSVLAVFPVCAARRRVSEERLTGAVADAGARAGAVLGV